MARVRDETRAELQNLMEILVEERGPSFFDLRVRPQDKVLRRCADTEMKTKYNRFIEGYNDHLAYIAEKGGEYQTMMTALREIPSFTRIISQNMHCRAEGGCFIYDKCKGEACFKDNQVGRAQALGKAIKENRLSFDILCLQEVQHDEARGELVKILNETDYGFVFDKGTVIPSLKKIAETLVGREEAKNPKLYKQALEFVVSYLPTQERKNVLDWQPETEEQDLFTFLKGTVNSGLMIIYKKSRFEVVGSPLLYHFPSLFSSGADRTATGIRSFKGALFLRLRDRLDTSRTILLCNTHPSPYVTVPQKTVRSYYDWQIKLTHVYQLTLVAMQMKKLAEEFSVSNGNKKEFLFTCGDMNINKYLQTGSMVDVPPELFETPNVTAPTENVSFINKASAAVSAASSAASSAAATAFKRVSSSNSESSTVNEDSSHGTKLFKHAYTRAVERAPSKTCHTALRNPKFTKKNVKTMFARSTPTELWEACFRDDVPYISHRCDTTCCGSEYMTMREILAGVAPAHLVSLPESPEEVVAPLHGKYTWDGLFNTVVFSPHWSQMSFQLIDHFFYNAFGRIPSYAHVMTKRYICDPPVNVTEGPLSRGCYEKAPCGAKTKRFDFGEPSAQGETAEFFDYKYYDFADHYAIECCLILDDSDDTIRQITNATTKPINELTDEHMKQAIREKMEELTINHTKRSSRRRERVDVSKMDLTKIGLEKENWRVLLGLRLLPDNLPNTVSANRSLEQDKQLYNRPILYPRRWFFSLETPNELDPKNKLISYPNISENGSEHEKQVKLLDRRYIFFPYANKLVQQEQYLASFSNNNMLRSTNASEPFAWQSYLPDITSFSTNLTEFQQFAVKAFNRMLERETINRSWQLREGWKKYTQEVYMDTDLSSPDCRKTQSKTLHKCVTFKNKNSQSGKINTKTRRHILRSLNMQERNTLQNAKENARKREHTAKAVIPDLQLQSITSGNSLYRGATETEYIKPLRQTVRNTASDAISTARGALSSATGAVTGALSTATGFVTNTARRLSSYVTPSPTAPTAVVQEQIPTPVAQQTRRRGRRRR
jgi:hypothetical protein